MILMSKREVDMLYKLVPGLDDPYYKGKELLYTVGETSYIKVTVYDECYICQSNPYLDDVWYHMGLME